MTLVMLWALFYQDATLVDTLPLSLKGKGGGRGYETNIRGKPVPRQREAGDRVIFKFTIFAR